ncbi:MAG TPA: PH domain-containing protein [Anaerolineae bacterium]|nr:PH domain-containing protein [Anaerolineae bacterium]
MGIINGLLGNATTLNPEEVQKKHADILTPGEEVHAAFKVIRDSFIFTNKRLILIDVQGITGKKVEYLTIPYKSIKYFTVETAGRFDLDAELKIWASSSPQPTVNKQLKKGTDVIGLQRTLAHFVIN